MKPSSQHQPLRRRLIGAAAAALCTFGALGPLQAQTAELSGLIRDKNISAE